MFEHYRTKGIIIKKEDRGEADQLLTIYTKHFGRLEILAKGIRKITSKLRSATEIFYLSKIEFIQGKTCKTLTDAILIDRFSNLRKDLKGLAVAYKISEICANLIKGEESDENIWHLLNEVFNKLNEPSFPHLSLLYYFFFWNFISFLGYQPDLFNCVDCQKKLTPTKLYFNPREGGIICEKCFSRQNFGEFKELKSCKKIYPHTKNLVVGVEPEVIKILRLILKGDWNILSRLKIGISDEKSLNIVSKNYLLEIDSILTKNKI